MAVEPGEAASFVRRLREAEIAMGRPRRAVSETESDAKANARRSAFARVDIHAGEYPVASMIEWRRPATGGIEPGELGHFMQRPLARTVKAGEQIRKEDMA